MKFITCEYNGATYQLSCTAQALFSIYEKFGYTTDIIETTKITENTNEGWKNACWMFALFAMQGELQRRLMGEDKQPMIQMEELFQGSMPTDVNIIRRAVADALAQGFRREVPDPEKEEIDLVLMELEEREKKKTAQAASGFLTSLFAGIYSIFAPGTRSF